MFPRSTVRRSLRWQGQAADIEIQAKEILFIRALLCECACQRRQARLRRALAPCACSPLSRYYRRYIADYTGQPVDKIEEDCDRDFFMTPEEAKDYGIIDEATLTLILTLAPAQRQRESCCELSRLCSPESPGGLAGLGGCQEEGLPRSLMTPKDP